MRLGGDISTSLGQLYLCSVISLFQRYGFRWRVVSWNTEERVVEQDYYVVSFIWIISIYVMDQQWVLLGTEEHINRICDRMDKGRIIQLFFVMG